MRNVHYILRRASIASGTSKAWVSHWENVSRASYSAQTCAHDQQEFGCLSVGGRQGKGSNAWAGYGLDQTSKGHKCGSNRLIRDLCRSDLHTHAGTSGWMASCAPHQCISKGQKERNRTSSTVSDGPGHDIAPLEFLNTLINYEKIGVPIPAVDPTEKQLTLDRTKKLLAELGNPQNSLKVVHVVGSKGKGSTCALIAAILHASGLKVGVYTSPHVNELNERIHLTGGVGPPISTPALEEAIEGARSAIIAMKEEGDPPTFFEALTAIAFKKFADEKVDIAVIEAGIGGRTDATNIFEPDSLCAAVVTPIAKEHLEQLGGSLESIAVAKAGILKHNRPVIVSDQQHEVVKAILREQASDLACDYISVKDTVAVETIHTELQSSGMRQEIEISMKGSWEGMARMWSDRVKTGMLGNHQNCNIATATRTVFELYKQGYVVAPESISKGLALVQLPGRFQVFRPNEGSPWLLLDGAHTRESAGALVQTVKSVFSPSQPVALVVAIMQGKDFSAVLRELAQLRPVAAIFTKVSAFGGQRSMPPGSLVAYWEIAEADAWQPGQGSNRCRKMIQASVSSAVHRAMTEVSGVSKDGIVCVTGSLYAVSDALASVDHPQES